jgi:2-polyprenyl-6-methoxyphenol hydroxylase-like FAD-dependent oxidoreductase
VRVRIVDAVAEPGTTSRALVVHARTLELYRQMGLADGLREEGVPFRCFNLWVRGRRVARVDLGLAGAGTSAFPMMHVVTQDRHERFLIRHLAALGIAVERPVRLLDFEQDAERVCARLAGRDGREELCEARYLAGCDGARSRVREVLGVGFPGGTYSHVFFVADLDATGPVMNGELHIALDESELLGVFPLRGGRTARVIGTVRTLDEHDGSELGWNDVAPRSLARLGIEVERVNWFSTYRVHHRVAGAFARGRAFLLGDAAHIHSPAGGQGMNTGIGDAVNLSWKLADVLHGRAAPQLLESYAPERRAFAQKLVATTDRAFRLATSPGGLARFVRTRIVPLLAPPIFRLPAVRRFQFRTLSQTAIHYRASVLSAGQAGRVRGGDRLPWVALEAGDNHAPLDGIAWQAHVHGTPRPELERACAQLAFALRAFPWTDAARRAGLARDALYLVRPDGHVALADAHQDAARLERYAADVLGRAPGAA